MMGPCGVNTAVLLDTPVAVCCGQHMVLKHPAQYMAGYFDMSENGPANTAIFLF
jgi:hypothetical protein